MAIASCGVGLAQTAAEGEAVPLDPISVEGVADEGYVAESAATASRLSIPIAETPRSISVVTREQLDDQAPRSVEEAIQYTPGVVTGSYGLDHRYDQFTLRGFEAQNSGLYRDGMILRTFGWTGWRTEPFGLDRVEVLRGVTADLYGANEPGGMINAISKKPQDAFGGLVQAQFTSLGGYQLAGDVTGPFAEGSPVSYRLVGVFKNAQSEIEHVEDDRKYIAPSITIAPSDDTRITFLGQYQRDDFGGNYQLYPIYGTLWSNPLGEIDKGSFLGDPENDKISTEQATVGYEFEHKLTDELTLRSRGRYGYADWDNHTAFPQAYYSLYGGAPAINVVAFSKFDAEQEAQQGTIDASLEYAFEEDWVDAKILVGADHYRSKSFVDYAFGYAGEQDVFTGGPYGFLGGLYPTDLPNWTDQRQQQNGLYTRAHAKFWDQWILSGGLRQDFLTTETDAFTSTFNTATFTTTQATTHNRAHHSALTGSIGVAYESEIGLTPYASFATSFNAPPAGITSDGGQLEPEEATQYEIGLRYQPKSFEGMFSIAAFQIDKANDTDDDPFSTDPTVLMQAGETRSRGVELEARAQFGGGFGLIGAYTYLDTEILEDANFEGNELARVPNHAASLWLTYDFEDGPLSGFGLGGGARYIGERYANSANDLKLSSVTLFDARVQYTLEDTGTSLSLNASNVFDKEYVAYCGGTDDLSGFFGGAASPAYFCNYGEGREVTLTLTQKF